MSSPTACQEAQPHRQCDSLHWLACLSELANRTRWPETGKAYKEDPLTAVSSHPLCSYHTVMLLLVHFLNQFQFPQFCPSASLLWQNSQLCICHQCPLTAVHNDNAAHHHWGPPSPTNSDNSRLHSSWSPIFVTIRELEIPIFTFNCIPFCWFSPGTAFPSHSSQPSASILLYRTPFSSLCTFLVLF